MLWLMLLLKWAVNAVFSVALDVGVDVLVNVAHDIGVDVLVNVALDDGCLCCCQC